MRDVPITRAPKYPTQLHAGGPNSTSDRVDQEVLARLESALKDHGIECGHEDLGDGRGLDQIHPAGSGNELIGPSQSLLCVPTSAQNPHDAIADLPRINPIAERIDLAGELHPKDLGGPALGNLVPPLSLKQVGTIDARCGHPHPHLSGPGLGQRDVS